jgi:hypothetical protein
VFSSSFIIKIPKSLKRWSIEKEKERERESIEKKRKEKIKDLRVYANKKGKSIISEEKHISTSKSLYVSPFSPPPSYQLINSFQNCLRKFHSSFWTIL